VTPQPTRSSPLFQQLSHLGYFHDIRVSQTKTTTVHRHQHNRAPLMPTTTPPVDGGAPDDTPPPGVCVNELIETSRQLNQTLARYVAGVCKQQLVQLATLFNKWHCDLLNTFILTAYDMARDQNITPKRLAFAKWVLIETHTCKLQTNRTTTLRRATRSDIESTRSTAGRVRTHTQGHGRVSGQGRGAVYVHG
jgi:hypothetical protein